MLPSAEVWPASLSSSRSGCRRAGRGFTLLELLVVLTIVGLSAGIMVPALSRAVDAAQERAWTQELGAALAALPLKAFHGGQPLQLDAEAVRALLPDQLPPDAEITLLEPLRYSAMGMARGGMLRVRTSQGRVHEWRIEPVSGQVRRPAALSS